MRPTDVCHPNESCAPAPRAFPAHSRHFRGGDALRRLRLRRVNRGTGCFTASATASADRRRSLIPGPRASRPSNPAWAFSSHGDERDRASDTPVAISASPHASAAFADRCILAVRPPFGRFRAGRRVRLPPRPPLTPSRERRRLVMIRDAFRRQEPFVGSGGHYSPGPATPPPLLAMWGPLDDDLSPPWALRRSSPVSSGEADSRRSFRST